MTPAEYDRKVAEVENWLLDVFGSAIGSGDPEESWRDKAVDLLDRIGVVDPR